ALLWLDTYVKRLKTNLGHMKADARRGVSVELDPEIAGVFRYVLLRPPCDHYRRLTDPSVRGLLHHHSGDYGFAVSGLDGWIDADQSCNNNRCSGNDGPGEDRLTHISTPTVSIVPPNTTIVLQSLGGAGGLNAQEGRKSLGSFCFWGRRYAG